MLSDEFSFAYKYPFSDDAKRVIKAFDFDLENVPRERLQASKAIALSLAGNVKPEFVSASDDSAIQVFLTDYVLVKILIALTESDTLKRGLARRYSDHSYEFLKSEPANKVFDLLINTLELDADVVNSEKHAFKVALRDYLRYPISLEDLRLVNQDVSQGYVYLSEVDAKLFVKNQVFWRVYNSLNEKNYSSAPAQFHDASKDVKSALFNSVKAFAGGKSFGRVEPNAFPPCMRLLYKSLNAGELPPHYANVAFATFMLNVGASKEQVTELYSKTPKFDERVVSYQLDYLQGKGSGKKYKMPSCKKLQDWSVCPLDLREDLCFKISNPISFYSKSKKKFKAAEKSSEASKDEKSEEENVDSGKE